MLIETGLQELNASRLQGVPHGLRPRTLARRYGVLFEGDRLPLAGLSVFEAKALLTDAWNIRHFADAIVNGHKVPVAHILRPGDRLGFSQRFGFKGGENKPAEQAQAEALVIAYPELQEMAAKVGQLDIPKDDSLRIMAMMVSQWVDERFGPPSPNMTLLLGEILKRLQAIESALGKGSTALTGRAPALTDTEELILEALGDRSMKAASIANAAGLNHNSHLKSSLSSLVKRGILRNGPAGYSINMPFRSGPGQD